MELMEKRYPQSSWYRIEEREDTKARADKSLVGTFWKVTQELVRVGYLWEPMDFDGWDTDKKALEMMAASIAGTMRFWDNSDKLGERAKLIAKELTEDFGDRVIPHYNARGALVKELNGPNPLRTFWYRKTEVLGQGHNYFMVTGTKRCVTGRYYPGRTSSGYWDGYDYEPAYIGDPVHHTVFTGLMFCDFGGPDRFDLENFETWGRKTMMHPLDLVERIYV